MDWHALKNVRRSHSEKFFDQIRVADSPELKESANKEIEVLLSLCDRVSGHKERKFASQFRGLSTQWRAFRGRSVRRRRKGHHRECDLEIGGKSNEFAPASEDGVGFSFAELARASNSHATNASLARDRGCHLFQSVLAVGVGDKSASIVPATSDFGVVWYRARFEVNVGA